MQLPTSLACRPEPKITLQELFGESLNLISLTFLECNLLFDMEIDKSKVILTARNSILAISAAQFVFDVRQIADKTQVTIDFSYSMGWLLDVFAGTVKQLAGKLTTTVLRHLAMGFTPAPTQDQAPSDQLASMKV